MKIGLLTFHLANYQAIVDLTQPGKEEYAARHGYVSFVQKEVYDPAYDLSFQRVKLIRDYLLLHPEIDWLWVHGVDTIITNHNVRLEEFIEKHLDKHFLITKDINGINDDSFLIRNNAWAQRWLGFILSKSEEYKNDCWSSQRVIQHNEYHDEFKDGIQILSHPSINSYLYRLYQWGPETPGDWRPGHFLLHLPGLNLQERLNILQSSEIQTAIIQ